jgi:hypothetical protein
LALAEELDMPLGLALGEEVGLAEEAAAGTTVSPVQATAIVAAARRYRPRTGIHPSSGPQRPAGRYAIPLRTA